MEKYFAKEYLGEPFKLFGVPHLVTLAVFFLLGVIILRSAKNLEPGGQRTLRNVLVVLLLANELSWHVWNLAFGSWNIRTMLPLHMCSAMIWITIAVLLLEKPSFYPLIYFLGVAGAIQALITPDAGIYGFPHFRYFQTMIAHGGLVILGLWVVMIERCRPDFKSLVRVMVGLNVYALAVWIINTGIGSNYMYMGGKPETTSILDFFPAWPWYFLILEALAILFLGLLYLPFRDNTRKQKRPATQGAPAFDRMTGKV